MKIAIFWFRRDLRLDDNAGLERALASGFPVQPIFIFDSNILEELPADDARVSFIYKTLHSIHQKLKKSGSSHQTINLIDSLQKKIAVFRRNKI